MKYSKEERAARVAWAYYYEDKTQAEIARQMNLSRAVINQILQQGRETGLVQIVINSDSAGCAQAESALERKYGLVKAVVVPTPERDKDLFRVIGRAAGAYVSDMVRDGQTLGLGWGTALRSSADGLVQRDPSDITLVSLFGGLPNSSTTNPYDVASMFARKLSAAACYYIAAPMYVSDESVRKALMAQPMFAEVFKRAMDVDVALIGLGDLTTRSTNVRFGAVTTEEWNSLREAGAVGEIFGYFVDAQGAIIEHPLNRRFMGFGLDRLLNIPMKIAVAGGMQKIAILKAALNGAHLDILVTDEQTAKALVQ